MQTTHSRKIIGRLCVTNARRRLSAAEAWVGLQDIRTNGTDPERCLGGQSLGLCPSRRLKEAAAERSAPRTGDTFLRSPIPRQKLHGEFQTLQGLRMRISNRDLTWETTVATVFIFKEYGSEPRPHLTGATSNRTKIRAIGVEMILNASERADFQTFNHPPYPLRITPERARLYDISCQSDGLLPRDLARAVSLYRTAVMEQPGVRHTEVEGDIKNLKPLDASDVTKAIYALKFEWWTDSCTGDVDEYRTCGTFKLWFVLPFGVVAAVIVLAWVVVRCAVTKVPEKVPIDAASWRSLAFALSRKMSWHTECFLPHRTPPGKGRERKSSAVEPYVSTNFQTSLAEAYR